MYTALTCACLSPHHTDSPTADAHSCRLPVQAPYPHLAWNHFQRLNAALSCWCVLGLEVSQHTTSGVPDASRMHICSHHALPRSTRPVFGLLFWCKSNTGCYGPGVCRPYTLNIHHNVLFCYFVGSSSCCIVLCAGMAVASGTCNALCLLLDLLPYRSYWQAVQRAVLGVWDFPSLVTSCCGICFIRLACGPLLSNSSSWSWPLLSQ